MMICPEGSQAHASRHRRVLQGEQRALLSSIRYLSSFLRDHLTSNRLRCLISTSIDCSTGKRVSRIYVQIPAYRDTELWPTLLSLYAQAFRPECLRVRVLWQHAPGELVPRAVARLPRLEIEAVAANQSEGCNWARSRLQSAWNGEEHTLLLDSHHRFVRGWDRQALAMLQALRENGVSRPLLTAYLPAYVPGVFARRRRRPYKIYPLEREDGLLTRLTSLPIRNWAGLKAPIKADFVSLHFILAEGAFNLEVPLDAHVYFFGDEIRTSLLAYAAGYRFFHPHRVLGWHAYDRSTRQPHWADHEDWVERNRASLAHLRHAYRPDSFVEGTRVRVSDYERYSGVSLDIQ